LIARILRVIASIWLAHLQIVMANFHFMRHNSETITILIAENDPGDRLMIEAILADVHNNFDVHFVADEDELIAYLEHVGKYAQPNCSPTPHLILLDLNMPHQGSQTLLSEIRAEPHLSNIPVIGLTPARPVADLFCNYHPGGNSYVSKPTCFEEMVDLIEIIDRYWFELIKLPDLSSLELFG
jgi:CheY-like chemotaxis protein